MKEVLEIPVGFKGSLIETLTWGKDQVMSLTYELLDGSACASNEVAETIQAISNTIMFQKLTGEVTGHILFCINVASKAMGV